MLSRDSFISSPEVQQLITSLTATPPVDFNRRQHVREAVVCPVTLQFQYELDRHKAFSKNLSVSGICIISQKAVEADQIATLSICRLDDVAMKVRGRCIWSKPFGNDFTISGWRFLRKVLQ